MTVRPPRPPRSQRPRLVERRPRGAGGHAGRGRGESGLDADVLPVLPLRQVLYAGAVLSARVPDHPVRHVALPEAEPGPAGFRDNHAVARAPVHELSLLLVGEWDRRAVLRL